MSVIPLTLTISICLVGTFLIFFLREQARRPFTSVEREALLPLAEEGARIRAAAAAEERGSRHSAAPAERPPSS